MSPIESADREFREWLDPSSKGHLSVTDKRIADTARYIYAKHFPEAEAALPMIRGRQPRIESQGEWFTISDADDDSWQLSKAGRWRCEGVINDDDVYFTSATLAAAEAHVRAIAKEGT